MKRWDKINWPALNRRAREIEAELWQWSLAQHDFKEKGVAAPIAQADHATTLALMVWADDGGPAAYVQSSAQLSRVDENDYTIATLPKPFDN